MAPLSLSVGKHLVPDREMAFAPRQVVATAPRKLDERQVEVQYRVRSINSDRGRVVESDPMVERPLPLVRLLANAAATFILVLTAGLVVAAAAPRLFGYESVVVVSGSMEPAIRVADVVVTSQSNGENLREGAVINFEHGDSMRLHRIAAVTDDGYRTSGDANQVADTEIVSPSQVRGVGVVVVPFVGLPATWVERGQWMWIAAAVVVLSAAAYISRARWAEVKNEMLLL